jgi:hypothetical protein
VAAAAQLKDKYTMQVRILGEELVAFNTLVVIVGRRWIVRAAGGSGL